MGHDGKSNNGSSESAGRAADRMGDEKDPPPVAYGVRVKEENVLYKMVKLCAIGGCACFCFIIFLVVIILAAGSGGGDRGSSKDLCEPDKAQFREEYIYTCSDPQYNEDPEGKYCCAKGDFTDYSSEGSSCACQCLSGYKTTLFDSATYDYKAACNTKAKSKSTKSKSSKSKSKSSDSGKSSSKSSKGSSGGGSSCFVKGTRVVTKVVHYTTPGTAPVEVHTIPIDQIEPGMTIYGGGLVTSTLKTIEKRTEVKSIAASGSSGPSIYVSNSHAVKDPKDGVWKRAENVGNAVPSFSDEEQTGNSIPLYNLLTEKHRIFVLAAADTLTDDGSIVSLGAAVHVTSSHLLLETADFMEQEDTKEFLEDNLKALNREK